MHTKRVVAALVVVLWGAALAPFTVARSAAAAAAVINVPADQPTIQAAIDAANPGDTVVVAPGTYHERINFLGKAIEVRSASNRTATIHGDQGGSVVTFASGETRASVLRGFGIIGGQAPPGSIGGGISVANNSSPSLLDNYVHHNSGGTSGGAGIGIIGGAPLLQKNIIESNEAPGGTPEDTYGGGLLVVDAAAEVVGNTIGYNTAPAGGGVAIRGTGAVLRDNRITFNKASSFDGGGILFFGATNAVMIQNVITGNSAVRNGGGIASRAIPPAAPRIVHNTVTRNTAAAGSGLYLGSAAPVVVVNNIFTALPPLPVAVCESTGATFAANDFYNGATAITGCGPVVGNMGNISADPRFAGGFLGVDPHLTAPSPAIDTGFDLIGPVGPGPADQDFEGKPRVLDGDRNGTAVRDMGAFEAASPRIGFAGAVGWNATGQLGDGSRVDRPSGVAVNGLTNVASMAAGVYHSLALTFDGTVWAWGWNGVGQLGDGTTTDRATPVQLAGLADIVAISAGAYQSFALRSDGTLFAWGWNGVGVLGDGTTTDRHTPTPVVGLPAVTAVAGGAYHTVALKADGTVWAWGWNGVGQLGDGTTTDHHSPAPVAGLTGVYALAAGYHHNVAVSNASLYLWGWNATGQLGIGTTVDSAVPVKSNGASGIVRVAAGAYHTLAVEGDGTAYSWGWNGVGQLGNGTTTQRQSPGLLSIGGRAVDAAAGAFHSVLLMEDGSVRTFGWNAVGQLGDGTTIDRHTPTPIPNLAGAKVVAAGAHHTLIA